MKEKRRSFEELAEELKKLRQRQIPQREIDEFNEIMNKETKPSVNEQKDQPERKIAEVAHLFFQRKLK